MINLNEILVPCWKSTSTRFTGSVCVCVCVVQSVQSSLGNNSLNLRDDFSRKKLGIFSKVSFGNEHGLTWTPVQDIEGIAGFVTRVRLSK